MRLLFSRLRQSSSSSSSKPIGRPFSSSAAAEGEGYGTAVRPVANAVIVVTLSLSAWQWQRAMHSRYSTGECAQRAAADPVDLQTILHPPILDMDTTQFKSERELMKHANKLYTQTNWDGSAPLIETNCKSAFVRGKFLYDYEFFIGPRVRQKFESKQFDVADLMLENPEVRKHYDGVFGYFRLTPFLMEGTKMIVFINRGWQEGNKSIYETSQPDTTVKASGIIVHGESTNMEPLLSIQESEFAKKWGFYREPIAPNVAVRQMRIIGLKKLAGRLQTLLSNTPIEDHNVMPVLVNLRAVEGPKVVTPNIVRNPVSSYTTSCISPERNMAYAAQWLALAGGVGVLAYGRKMGSLLVRAGRGSRGD